MLQEFMNNWAIGFAWLVGSLIEREIFRLAILPFASWLMGRTKNKYDDCLVEAAKYPGYFAIIGTGVCSFISNTPLIWLLEGSPLHSVRMTLLWIVVYWYLYDVIRRIENHYFENIDSKERKKVEEVRYLAKLLVRGFFICIAIITIAHEWKQNILGLITSLGIGGFAIAFAMKDVIENFLSGLILFIDKPFVEKDFISINGIEGYIVKVCLRSTKIKTYEGSYVFIPNSVIVKSVVENITHTERKTRKIRFRISLQFDTSLEKIENLMDQIKAMFEKMHAEGRLEAEYSVTLDKIGPASFEILVIYTTKSIKYQEYLDTRNEVNVAVVKLMESLGLQFASLRVSFIEK